MTLRENVRIWLNGAEIGPTDELRLQEGTGITFVATYEPSLRDTVLTISSSGGGGGAHDHPHNHDATYALISHSHATSTAGYVGTAKWMAPQE